MLDVDRGAPAEQRELSRAAAIVREQQARLAQLLADARQKLSDMLGRLRQLERSLIEIGTQIATARTADTSVSETDRALTIASLQERQQTLRRQQVLMTERITQFQSNVRKLYAVVKQSQMSADYLSGTIGDADDLSSLAQVWALEAQEEERRRLAREIHDGPAQVLANAVFALEYCQLLAKKDPLKLDTELGQLKSDLREGLADVRYFIFDLRPAPLAEVGLAATIQRYGESFKQRFGVNVDVQVDHGMGRLPTSQETAIFRIVQEALQNVRKHSGATEVSIRIDVGPDGVTAVVADNGRGFETSAQHAGTSRHFGLATMQERARLIKADLRLISSPGEGTRVELRIPPEPVPVEA